MGEMAECERCRRYYPTMEEYANDENLPNKCGKCLDKEHKDVF